MKAGTDSRCFVFVPRVKDAKQTTNQLSNFVNVLCSLVKIFDHSPEFAVFTISLYGCVSTTPRIVRKLNIAIKKNKGETPTFRKTILSNRFRGTNELFRRLLVS